MAEIDSILYRRINDILLKSIHFCFYFTFITTVFAQKPILSLEEDSVKIISAPKKEKDSLTINTDSVPKSEVLIKNVVNKKIKKQKKIDTTHYSPKKAALWALACPGLGQIYMKKYWKLPIVYGLLGTVLYFVASNAKSLKQYNGYIRNYYNNISNPAPYNQLNLTGLETYQSYYRKNVQLASFGTLFVWGLSIVDAVVDAHLHAFDISDNLSIKIKPTLNKTNNSYYTGIALNLAIK